MAQGHEMIERWQGRFGLVESLTLVRDLPCAVPGVTLALVDVLGKRGDLQGIHLLQVYTGGDPNTVIEAQGRVERLSVDQRRALLLATVHLRGLRRRSRRTTCLPSARYTRS
jgi:hypothetical protein